MAYEQGNDIKVTIGEQVIGGQTGCSINYESETAETTTKDSGDWSEEEVTGLSWSVDLDGMIVVGDAGLKALRTAWVGKQKVTVKVGTPQAFETGQAIITSYSKNSPAKEKSTYSVSLKGVGELTEGTAD